jgi:hypothetical protein
MHSELFFKGKKITDKERRLLADVFEMKIDDLYLCQSILLAAMKPEHALARSAFTRALTKKRCAYTDGGREARKLIRRTRRKLGYSLSFGDRVDGIRKTSRNLGHAWQKNDQRIMEDLGNFLAALARLVLWLPG